MVKSRLTEIEERRDRVFHALADSTRREIVQRITTGNRTVAELSEPFGISAPAISRHLRVLESSGLITRHKEWRTHRFSLNESPLRDAQSVLNELSVFWLRRLLSSDN
jgi:DNA-binding transcriptional ArsR family regulator